MLAPDAAIPYQVALAALFHLSRREAEALELFIGGMTAREVAVKMGVTTSTAKSFLRLITIKMGVSGRTELMSKVLGFTCSASFECPFRASVCSYGDTNPQE
jgi:DNA-binding CsgD family transcriptional regulator